MIVVALFGIGMVGLLACQGGSGSARSGSAASGSAASGSAASGSAAIALDAAVASPPPAPVEPARVTLPKSPSTPPVPTARALTRRELERLAAFAFDDFEHEQRALTDQLVELRHTTRTRPKLGVVVAIEPCGRAIAPPVARRTARRAPATQVATPPPCTAMALEPWLAKGDELKRFLSKELVARPDTRFEVGARDILGVTAIYTYQLGYFFGKDEHDQPVGAYSDAYILYYNDGVNQIRVNAHYRDDALGSRDRLLEVAPPEDLEKLAVSFLSFYIHHWQ